MVEQGPAVERLSERECWARLRTVGVGRLAVRVADHPDAWFVRIVPTTITGRRFPVAGPGVWQTPLTGTRPGPLE